MTDCNELHVEDLTETWSRLKFAKIERELDFLSIETWLFCIQKEVRSSLAMVHSLRNLLEIKCRLSEFLFELMAGFWRWVKIFQSECGCVDPRLITFFHQNKPFQYLYLLEGRGRVLTTNVFDGRIFYFANRLVKCLNYEVFILIKLLGCRKINVRFEL